AVGPDARPSLRPAAGPGSGAGLAGRADGMGTGAPPGLHRSSLAGRAADPRSPARPASGRLDGSGPADSRADRSRLAREAEHRRPAGRVRAPGEPQGHGAGCRAPGARRRPGPRRTRLRPGTGPADRPGAVSERELAAHLGPVRAHDLGAVRPRRRPGLPLRPRTPARRHRGLVPAPARRGVTEAGLLSPCRRCSQIRSRRRSRRNSPKPRAMTPRATTQVAAPRSTAMAVSTKRRPANWAATRATTGKTRTPPA